MEVTQAQMLKARTARASLNAALSDGSKPAAQDGTPVGVSAAAGAGKPSAYAEPTAASVEG